MLNLAYLAGRGLKNFEKNFGVPPTDIKRFNTKPPATLYCNVLNASFSECYVSATFIGKAELSI